MTPKIKERTCEGCKGTGFPVVMQPVQRDRKSIPLNARRVAVGERFGRLSDLTSSQP
jgi:hypothetical protein